MTASRIHAGPRTWSCAVLTALALAAVPSTAGAATDSTVRLRLDARKGMQPVRTPAALKKGVKYIATVQGTFAYYGWRDWLKGKNCGPARKPMFPSPGVRNTLTGTDAEFTFAAFPDREGKCGALPFAFTDFQISTGLAFTHRKVIGGRPLKPNAQHRYSYLLVGRGKKASFRLRDTFTGDNYGVARITVKRAPKGYVPPVPAPPVAPPVAPPAPAPVVAP